MKDFMKYTLATILGIVLASVLITFLCLLSAAGMMATRGMSAPIHENSILRIKLQGTIVEREQENPLSFLTGDEIQNISLEDALVALKKAATNENVKGIYLEGGALSATPAMAEELRDALVEFKKSGKWIIAYGDRYTKTSYYLCSTADQVLLNPIGMLEWSGMASEPMFYKDAMAKIGVKMQVFKVGTYKSAVEPYICTEMSDANREQVTSFLTSIWGKMLQDVAKSRKLKVEALNSLADSMTYVADPQIALKGGLVDKMVYLSDVKDILRKKVGLDDDDDLTFTNIHDVATSEEIQDKIDEKVAIYYAYGEIVEDVAGGLSQDHQIVGKDMIQDLQKLREDDDVKAVVIRVNSPGGSAYASEQIWHEVTLLREKKPVVISMGGMAASGGYYISCGANKIFAEPTTLTGSIGIFGMVPDMSELVTEKIGLKFDVVKTNALSDFGGSLGRPFSPAECALMQAHVNKGYELFTGRVAMGRKMKIDAVKAIAEGRVWTGAQALEIGLVDKLGNLDDAVKAAAKLAETDKYRVTTYPEPENFLSTLLKDKKAGYLDSELREALGEYYTTFSLLKTISKQNPIQARIPFDPNIK